MNFELFKGEFQCFAARKCALARRSAAHVPWRAELKAGTRLRAFQRGFRRAKIRLAVVSLLCWTLAPAHAQDPNTARAPIFPRVRALSLERSRALARERSATIALAQAKFAQAKAEEREVSRRLKLDTTGGLDPFSRQIRFYVALDLERLLGLNRQERERARQATEQGRIGRQSAQAEAMKGATTAWYALASANAGVTASLRRREAARALYVVADARFKAGQGELGSVMTALQGTYSAEDAFEQARQTVALSCLELAQSCGYATAEEMEAALSQPEARSQPEGQP